MCDGVVIRLPDGGEACIPIYVEVERYNWPPDVESWKDLHILATINELASQLGSERMRTQLTETIRDSAQQVVQQLPGGFELGSNFMALSRQAAAD